MAEWRVVLTVQARKELRELLISKEISETDMHVLKLWLDEMENKGPEYIASSSEWHDHALEREWWGFRSSAFSSKGRIIYRVLGKFVVVEIHKITASHSYGR